MRKEFVIRRFEDPMTSTSNYPGGTAQLPHLEDLIGYKLVDPSGEKIGTLRCLWEDTMGQAAFLGVKTGWLGLGAIHVVPAFSAEFNQRGQTIRIPFSKDIVKDAPSFDENEVMSESRENEIYNYYSNRGTDMPGFTLHEPEPASEGQRPYGSKETREEARIPLHEEEVKIGKREVEAGGVRLRKIVRTETVQQPVEVSHEELVVEKVPASETRPGETQGAPFEAEDIFIPLRSEEPFVQKETSVREEMRVRKERATEKQNVSETIRKEELETQREGNVKERKL